MKKLKNEEDADDSCFVCKDGGELRICDYRDCLKSYHPECENKEDSFLDSDERWNCRWHQCMLCSRPSKFQCFTCPMAVCGYDLNWSEFIQVREHKGFCAPCLYLASLVEKNKNMDVVFDEEGVKVDFGEEATYERYFREYYEIIKKKEGITAQMTLSAMARFKQGKHKLGADNEEVYHSEDEGLVSEYDDIGDEVQEAGRKVTKKRKRGSGRPRKSNKSKASKFNGWATESIIAFLNSIGEDTTKPLSQVDVDSIIQKYIHLNKLASKRTVFCDEKLQSLFRKKSVKIFRISSLLEKHLAEYVILSDQEDGLNASCPDEEDDSSMAPSQNENKIISKIKSSEIEVRQNEINIISKRKSPEIEAPSTVKSCYAAIAAENIKLVYLRRNLVEKLLNGEPETFKDKLVGAFVRIKSDPYDYMQKNRHQLVKVISVNEASASGETRFVLQVSNRMKCIPISEVSDDDFSSEECDDLCQRVEVGLLDKITVVNLGQKAQMLHEDVTKHWITRQLVILQNQIDRANEKGWRRELHEYLDAKELLKTETEQVRLLREVPVVVAEEIKRLPPAVSERNEKSEIKFPQKIENDSSRLPNGIDLSAAGGKSLKVLEISELQMQVKEGLGNESSDFQQFVNLKDPLDLPSPVNISIMDDSGAQSGTVVEKASQASSRACQMKNMFLNFLKLDFSSFSASNNQSCFLDSLTTLCSKVGDFSPEQIAAMEKLIYEFPRLTSDYQSAEDTATVFQQFMQYHSYLLRVTKQYTAERTSIEVREKTVHENNIKLEAEIKQLQRKLNANNSEKETLFRKKQELASKIKEKSAKLAKASSKLDTWKIRQRQAIEERETVCAAWESFKKLFPSIGVNEASASGEDRFVLQVSNRMKCIPISEVSDDDFSSEECDDLCQRVEVGLLDKITVVNLEQKAQMVHKDVTKHVDHNRPCCRLILPTTRDSAGEQTTFRGQNDARMSTSEFKASLSSHASPSSLPLPHTSEHYLPNPSQNQKLDKCDSVESCQGEHASNGFTDFVTVKPLHSDSIASSLDRITSDNVLKANDNKEIKDGGNCKRAKISGEVNCSIGSSDTIEASILELEELACKVRWIKMVLDNGSPMLNTRPSWKFVENRVTAAPKI